MAVDIDCYLGVGLVLGGNRGAFCCGEEDFVVGETLGRLWWFF